MIADFDCISKVQLFFRCYPGRYLSFYGAAIRRIVRASLHFLKYIQFVYSGSRKERVARKYSLYLSELCRQYCEKEPF